MSSKSKSVVSQLSKEYKDDILKSLEDSDGDIIYVGSSQKLAIIKRSTKEFNVVMGFVEQRHAISNVMQSLGYKVNGKLTIDFKLHIDDARYSSPQEYLDIIDRTFQQR